MVECAGCHTEVVYICVVNDDYKVKSRIVIWFMKILFLWKFVVVEVSPQSHSIISFVNILWRFLFYMKHFSFDKRRPFFFCLDACANYSTSFASHQYWRLYHEYSRSQSKGSWTSFCCLGCCLGMLGIYLFMENYSMKATSIAMQKK
jgi:hypothetical protein